MKERSTLDPQDDSRWFFGDLEQALEHVAQRGSAGMHGCLDALGEYASRAEDIPAAAQAYRRTIEAVRRQGVRASVAIKLTALGLGLDPAAAEREVLSLFETAGRVVPIEIDMEGTPLVEPTIALTERLSARGVGSLTLAVQAYLRRSADDLARLSRLPDVRVRLVKGAYGGDFREFPAIQERMRDLAESLLASGRAFAFGTHDPELVSWLQGRWPAPSPCREMPRPPVVSENTPPATAERSGSASPRQNVEFGFLMGLADQTKLHLVRAGAMVSEYVPFGTNGAAYKTRRLRYLRDLALLGRQPSP
jgi:proline dehydrogenase